MTARLTARERIEIGRLVVSRIEALELRIEEEKREALTGDVSGDRSTRLVTHLTQQQITAQLAVWLRPLPARGVLPRRLGRGGQPALLPRIYADQKHALGVLVLRELLAIDSIDLMSDEEAYRGLALTDAGLMWAQIERWVRRIPGFAEIW